MIRGAAPALLLALLLPATAAAQSDLSVSASAHERGYIQLRVHARPGVEVVLQDASGAERHLTPAAPDTTLRRFASWRCDQRKRSFVARQPAMDGTLLEDTAVVRTPSCAHRLALAARARVRAGRRVLVSVRDRWGLDDVAARVCTRAPGAAPRCGPRRPGRFPYRALRAGDHLVELRTPWQRERRTIHAGHPGRRLTVLATGDSMIQIVDSYLKQRVGRGATRVRSDARVATGISKPSLLDWQSHARRQAASRPDVTVMFIGANDGFPMAGADCCGAPWVAAYARRARRMMRTYARGGRGRVYWLLLPAPRGGFFRELFPAVDAALRRAARGLEDDVRLIDLGRTLTPRGRYRESIRIGGKPVRVRQGDGIHLTAAGASLAASIVIRAMRADRMLR